MRRRAGLLSKLGVGLLVLGATFMGGAVPAQAAAQPTGCGTWFYAGTHLGYRGYCTNGNSSWDIRVVFRCDAPWYQLDYTVTGPQVRSTAYSDAFCRGDDNPYDSGVMLIPR